MFIDYQEFKIVSLASVGILQGFIESINPIMQFLIACATLFYVIQKGIKVRRENKNNS